MPRYLRKNHACQQWTNLLFWDTETLDDGRMTDEGIQRHTLRLGVARSCRADKGKYTRRRTLKYKSNRDFWAFVRAHADPKRHLYCFAHNIGFDLTISEFWALIDDGTLELSWSERVANAEGNGFKDVTRKGIFCDEDPPTIITVRDRETKAKITFVDSLNYYRCSLRYLGNMFNVPKLQMPEFDASDDEWFSYCERDVEVLELAITSLMSWFRDNDYGNFKHTQASLSMTAFRHRFMKHHICLDRSPFKDQLEEDSYMGGRLECFRLGEIPGKTTQLDVVSQYPSVMRNNSFPVECIATSENSFLELTPDDLTIEYIAKVKIKTDLPRIPLREKGVGTIYPVGEFWTTLAGPELVYAKKLGLVEEVSDWTKYKLQPIFREFVDHFYDKRRIAKEAGDYQQSHFLKILLNSLYGKWAQKTANWIDIGSEANIPKWMTSVISDSAYEEHCLRYHPDAPKNFIWIRSGKEDTVKYRMIGPHMQVKQPKNPHPRSFCGIASYVTSYARVMMDKLLDIAGREEVYYVVTDAIFVSEKGLQRLVRRPRCVGGRLGELSIEVSDTNFRLDTIHHYRLGDKVKRGSRKSRGVVSCPCCYQPVDEYATECESCGSPITELITTENRFEGIRGVLRRSERNHVRITEARKYWKRSYTRGTTEEGGYVSPPTYRCKGLVNNKIG